MMNLQDRNLSLRIQDENVAAPAARTIPAFFATRSGELLVKLFGDSWAMK
jgi:hypothetical protein